MGYEDNGYILPKKFKEDWIAALKGGDFIQGDGVLRDVNEYNPSGGFKETYCCLGVACAVAGMDEDDIYGEFIDLDSSDKFNIVPKQLQERAEEDESGELVSNKLTATLAKMNDDLNHKKEHVYTFTDIAKWIDQNIKGEIK